MGSLLTEMAASSVSELNAELPPLAPASTVPPDMPLLLSQARKVNVALPLQPSFGTNLI